MVFEWFRKVKFGLRETNTVLLIDQLLSIAFIWLGRSFGQSGGRLVDHGLNGLTAGPTNRQINGSTDRPTD